MAGIRPRIAPTMTYGIEGTNIYTDIINGAQGLANTVLQGRRDVAEAEFKREGVDSINKYRDAQIENLNARTEKTRAETKDLTKKKLAGNTAGTIKSLTNVAANMASNGTGTVVPDTVVTELKPALDGLLGGAISSGELLIAPSVGGVDLAAANKEAYDRLRSSFGDDVMKYISESPMTETNISTDSKGATKVSTEDVRKVTGNDLYSLAAGMLANMDRSDNPTAYDSAFSFVSSSIINPTQRSKLADTIYAKSLDKANSDYDDEMKRIARDANLYGWDADQVRSMQEELTRQHEAGVRLANEQYYSAKDKLEGARRFQTSYTMGLLNTRLVMDAMSDLTDMVESRQNPYYGDNSTFNKIFKKGKGPWRDSTLSEFGQKVDSYFLDARTPFLQMATGRIDGGMSKEDLEKGYDALVRRISYKVANPEAEIGPLSLEESKAYYIMPKLFEPYLSSAQIKSKSAVNKLWEDKQNGTLPGSPSALAEQVRGVLNAK